jgi:hypothetical protein
MVEGDSGLTKKKEKMERRKKRALSSLLNEWDFREPSRRMKNSAHLGRKGRTCQG